MSHRITSLHVKSTPARVIALVVVTLCQSPVIGAEHDAAWAIGPRLCASRAFWLGLAGLLARGGEAADAAIGVIANAATSASTAATRTGLGERGGRTDGSFG